jgi:hypothetical protein
LKYANLVVLINGHTLSLLKCIVCTVGKILFVVFCSIRLMRTFKAISLQRFHSLYCQKIILANYLLLVENIERAFKHVNAE